MKPPLHLDDCDYCENLPGGAFVANAVDGTRLVTDRGTVPVPFGGCLQVRIAPDGIRYAGHQHAGNDIALWTGSEWQDIGAGWGPSSAIFGADGALIIAHDGSVTGSQGWRYIDANGQPVPSYYTYSPDDPASRITQALGERDIFEMTVLPSGIRVGQGRQGGLVIRGLDGVLRQIEAGDCRFVRANEHGADLAVAAVMNGRASLHWLTVSEIGSLPRYAADVPPVVVVPPPQPTPKPEPVMSIPDLSSVFAAAVLAHTDLMNRLRALAAEGNARNWPQEIQDQHMALRGQLLRYGAYACTRVDPSWGLLKKTGGSLATRADGVTHATDILVYRPTMRLVDVFTDTDPGWSVLPESDTRTPDFWIQPLPEGTPPPVDVPPPSQPPPVVTPLPVDLTERLDAIDHALTALEAAMREERAAMVLLAKAVEAIKTPAATDFPDYTGKLRVFGQSATITLKPVKS